MSRKSGAKHSRHRYLRPREAWEYSWANKYRDTPADGSPAWRRAQKRLHAIDYASLPPNYGIAVTDEPATTHAAA